METRPYLLHALSPLHAGTGQAADVIDLPIARMKGAGIPIVPGSSIKGVLRDWFDNVESLNRDKHRSVFGPDPDEESGDHAGALMVLDARLLALPVRSFRGTFAWVTSPLLLDLARRDLGASAPPGIARILKRGAVASSSKALNVYKGTKVYLEDVDLEVETTGQQSAAVSEWETWLARVATPTAAGRLLVVDDETMAFFWETGTQVDTRVRINSETRTVAEGALWTEESLPPETLLIGLACADRSRSRHAMSPSEVLDTVLANEHTLQFGGKATVGRGMTRLIPLRSEEKKS